jgi:peroxiredoxin
MVRLTPLVVVMLIALADARLFAQNPPLPAPGSVQDMKPDSGLRGRRSAPNPKEIIRQLAEFYQRCQKIDVRCEMVETVRFQKEKLEHTDAGTFSITAERPNRLAVHANWGDAQLGLLCDGKTHSQWIAPPAIPKRDSDPVPNVYRQTGAPPSLDELVESWRFTGFMGLPQRPVVLQLLTDDPYEDLMGGVTAVSYAGEENLDGKRVHRVKFTQNVCNWEAWIAAEGDPVLQKVVIDITDGLFFRICSHSEKISVTITQRFKDWRFNQPARSQEFIFTPAVGATKSDEPIGGSSPANGKLVGTQASAVELKLVDDRTIKLGHHHGKSVVVLACDSQFFEPFANEAATLRSIAARYRNKGVVVYVVNTRPGNDNEARREARNKTFAGIGVHDERGEVGTALGLDSSSDFIAIIDKQGIVRAVHDQIWPGKAQLRRELDALLAGTSLLTNPPNSAAKASRPTGK